MRIPRKMLLGYFFEKAISNSYFRNTYWFSDNPSDEEFHALLQYISHISQYLLNTAPAGNDTIQSLIWFLSEFGHNGLNIPPRVDLRAHLQQAIRTEPALHDLKKYYRDHFFHALEVCFLGHFLLDLIVDGRRPLWQFIVRRNSSLSNYSNILKQWYFTALLHDVGYSINVLKGVKDHLKFFKNGLAFDNVDDELSEIFENLTRRIISSNYDDLSGIGQPGEDHGVIAALHLRGLLQNISSDDQLVNWESFIPALRAIAFHNTHEKIVSFQDDPLGFLLILCDTLQEWNRLQLNYAVAPGIIQSRLAGHPGYSGSLYGGFRNFFIEDLQHNRKFLLAPSSRRYLNFRIEYNPAIQFDAGVFNTWLDASYNLQRLDFHGIDIDIRIEYVTPSYLDSSGQWIQQMHRLRDAKNETHMNFIEGWFPENASGSVNYQYEPQRGFIPPKEHLILNLKKLSEIKPLTRDINAFREFLSKWKKFNDDRDFQGDYYIPPPY